MPALACLLACVVLVALGACGNDTQVHAPVVSIAAGSDGGTYLPVGIDLARILERLPDSPVEGALVWRTHGSIQNLAMLTSPRSEVLPPAGGAVSRTAMEGDTADFAFITSATLADESRHGRVSLTDVRALAAYPMNVAHLVTSQPDEIRSLADLQGKRIFCGPLKSGTRKLCHLLLAEAGVTEHACVYDADDEFQDGAERLVAGEVDAAIFLTGTPTEAVKWAMDRGKGSFGLLELWDDVQAFAATHGLGLRQTTIPARTYANQLEAVRTFSSPAVLCCRRDVPDEVVHAVLEAISGEIRHFLLSHARAQPIQIQTAEDLVPTDLIAFHPGARAFWEEEHGKLVIATGSVTGRYYRLGKILERALIQRGIPARAIHTDGSLANANLLASNRSMLAFMQHDVAVAAYWGSVPMVYGHLGDTEPEIPVLRGLRRLGALYAEKVHILARRSVFSAVTRPTVKHLHGLDVAMGPENSGSHVVAHALLAACDVEVTEHHLSAGEMVQALHAEDGPVDAAFFVSGVPSEALKAALSECDLLLIEVPLIDVQSIGGSAFRVDKIQPDCYPCQTGAEAAVGTISTRAMIVTNSEAPVDVTAVMNVLIDTAHILGVENLEELAEPLLGSPPLHPTAIAVYKARGLLPADPKKEKFPWLRPTWLTLACLVMLTAGYRGFLRLRRDTTGNRFGREILAVPLDARTADSVQQLELLQTDIHARVRRRWWMPGELSRSRWEKLDALIESRKRLARENLTRNLIADARMFGRLREREKLNQLAERAWASLVSGELDSDQQALVLSAIREADA